MTRSLAASKPRLPAAMAAISVVRSFSASAMRKPGQRDPPTPVHPVLNRKHRARKGARTRTSPSATPSTTALRSNSPIQVKAGAVAAAGASTATALAGTAGLPPTG